MGIVERLLTGALLRYWKKREPPPSVETFYSMNPTDSIQRTMNLIMPLANPSPIGKAQLVQTLASAVHEVTAGLNNTQIVHNGRFTIVGDYLVMFSVYDGDFSSYIRDFIYNIGSAFDGIMKFVADPPRTPVEDYPDEFVQWIRAHDAPQLPYQDIASLNPADDPDLTKLPRRLAILLDHHQHAQLYSYLAYPGATVAQTRYALDQGW